MDRLEGVVQAYDWGSPTAIADLCGVAPSGEPQAELWFGAHPRGPARLVERGATTLDELIADDPNRQIGPGRDELPFLAKLLAAAQPLSIQTHPDRAQAVAGFEREEREGVAIDAFDRSFRDRNPKPELICALTPFEALCGFRTPEEAADLIARWPVAALEPLVSALRTDAPAPDRLADALEWLLTRSKAEAEALVADVIDAEPSDLVLRLHRHHPGDIGVLVAPLLHHITLQPGEALYLEAGNLHSYLGGLGVELMVNSDNVVRGGLTSKHIDCPTLLALVDTTPGRPNVQQPAGPVHRYQGGQPDFVLMRIDHTDHTFEFDGPAIAIATEGSVALEADRSEVSLTAGQAAWIPASTARVHVRAETGQLHLATTGV
ncbi:MAG: mannose-6-phosphate isomerase, class I [Acidimicrobiales bacterium]